VAHQQQAVAGVPGRYALALYDLAQETNSVEETGEELLRFQLLLDGSEDLRRLVRSPVFSTGEQMAAIEAICDAAGVTGVARRLMLLLAKNRRLAALGDVIQAYRGLVARAKGELTTAMGRNVMLVTRTDESLIGGLIVKIGSRMIDASLKTKLQNLKMMMMKGAG
jgi:F-type H+-transporting ATPase subunit delta